MSSSKFTVAANVPGHITSITEKMAMGYYFKNASRGSKESIARGDALLNDAQAEVMGIAKFEIDLLDNSYAVIAQRSSAVRDAAANYHPTFGEDDPLLWNVDQNKLDDIESNRS